MKKTLYKYSDTYYTPVVTKNTFVYKHISGKLHQWEYKSGKLVLSVWRMPDAISLNEIRENKRDCKSFLEESTHKEPCDFIEMIAAQLTLNNIHLDDRHITLAFKWLNRIEKSFIKENKHNYPNNMKGFETEKKGDDKTIFRKETRNTNLPNGFISEKEIPYNTSLQLSKQEKQLRAAKISNRIKERLLDSCPVMIEKLNRKLQKLNGDNNE